MTVDELSQRVAARLASLPAQAQTRRKAIDTLLRGRAKLGGPPASPGRP